MRVWTLMFFVFVVVVLMKGVQTKRKGKGKGMNFLERPQFQDLSPDEILILDAWFNCSENLEAMIGQPCITVTYEELEQEMTKILKTQNKTQDQKLMSLKNFFGIVCITQAKRVGSGTCECLPDNFCAPQDEKLHITEESEKEVNETETTLRPITLRPVKSLGSQIDPRFQSMIFLTPLVFIHLY